MVARVMGAALEPSSFSRRELWELEKVGGADITSFFPSAVYLIYNKMYGEKIKFWQLRFLIKVMR
jgi:hypothetical protein